MRQGGGKEKGSIFERKIGSTLSLWLTYQERADLFSRNVLSGGRFTQDLRKGKPTGMPGDLVAAHPLAFDFLSIFCVECKHHKDIKLDEYLFEPVKSHMGRIVALAWKQSKEKGLQPLIIAKQNHRDTIVLTTDRVGRVAISSRQCMINHHFLYNSCIFMTRFSEFVLVDPNTFLANMKGELSCSNGMLSSIPVTEST